MANDKENAGAAPEADAPVQGEAAPAKSKPPAWAKDLRSLYDSVVNEPLPDSFNDLLSKLDQSEND